MARVATAVLVGLALASLAACGGGGDNARKRVEQYIEQVSAVQQRTNASMVRANQTYAGFARGQMRNAAGRKRLVMAEKSIRAARDQLAALRPPADARTLHTRLLHYYDDSADLAYETTLLARYEPAAQSALRSLPRLNRRLRSDLAAGKARDQVSALGAYTRGLDGVLRRLRALHPPPILLAAHNDQVARVARTRRLAGELRSALRVQNAPAIAKLLQRFRQAGGKSSPDVQRLSGQAVQAYDKRLRVLLTDAAAVERERRRLDANLK